MPDHAQRAAATSCLASAHRWRRQAQHLRDHAALPHLKPPQQAPLDGEAKAADRQADWWIDGAINAWLRA